MKLIFKLVLALAALVSFAEAQQQTGYMYYTPIAAPGTPNNGYFWYDSGTNAFRARVNGATVTIGTSGGTSPGGTTGQVQFNNAGVFGGTGPGGVTITDNGSGALTLAAAGTNQNITVTPSGTGLFNANNLVLVGGSTGPGATQIGLGGDGSGGLFINAPTGDNISLGQNRVAQIVMSANGTTFKASLVNGSAALAINATTGFFNLGGMPGVPTGVPSLFSGTIPLVYDSTDNLLYAYHGGWINLTGGGSYTFSDSLVNASGAVTLVNDSASPGNNQFYGTNASGVRGFYQGLVSGSININGAVYVSGSNTIASTVAMTNGQLMVGSTGTGPVAANISGTANQIAISNGAGSITLSIPSSPSLPGSPTTTTQLANDSSTKVATTAMVNPATDARGTVTTSATIDWSLSTGHSITLTASTACTITFSGVTGSASDNLTTTVVITGASGATVVWPTVRWTAGTAPTQSTSHDDFYTFKKVGTVIYGSVVPNMF